MDLVRTRLDWSNRNTQVGPIRVQRPVCFLQGDRHPLERRDQIEHVQLAKIPFELEYELQAPGGLQPVDGGLSARPFLLLPAQRLGQTPTSLMLRQPTTDAGVSD
jgi:hypothetical protein